MREVIWHSKSQFTTTECVVAIQLFIEIVISTSRKLTLNSKMLDQEENQFQEEYSNESEIIESTDVIIIHDPEVFLFAYDGDLDAVKAALNENPKIANAKYEGKTIWNNIENEEAVNSSNTKAACLCNSWTMLFTASRRGNRDIVSLLLDRGAAIEAQQNNGRNALIAAAFGGHGEVVSLLLDRGAAIETQDKNGQDALMFAAAQGHREVVSLLLDRGADIKALDKNGWNALIHAARLGHMEVVLILLDRGSAIDVKGTAGWNALALASFNAHVTTAVALILRGADVGILDDGKMEYDRFGESTAIDPPLTAAQKLEGINALKQARADYLLQKKRERNWQHRYPFMNVMTGCDFHPLAARQAVIAQTVIPLPPSEHIPDEPIETEEQRRALLHLRVFGNVGIMKTIGAFL